MVGCTLPNTGEGYNADGTYTGYGEIESKSYSFNDFSSLIISNDMDVVLKQGEKTSVEVITNSDVFEKLSIQLGDGVFKAGNNEDVVLSNTQVRMRITIPKLELLELENDVVLSFDGEWISDQTLNIVLNSDTQLSGRILADHINVNLYSDSVLQLSGSANTLNLNGASDSKMKLADLHAQSAKVKLESDALCDINVRGDIEFSAENSPVLNVYSGNVTTLNIDDDVTINMK